MSRENVEALRRSMEAFNRGDFATALEFFDPNAEWTAYLSALEAKTYRGRAEIASMWSEVREHLPDFRSDPTEIVDCGDSIVASLEFSGIGRGSGAATQTSLVHVYSLKDGRVIRVRPFKTREEALEAVGLQE